MTESPATSPTVFQDAADREAAERAKRAAAPVAASVETIGALEPRTRAALYALLSSLADNKYVLGRRYAEWCTGAPMLESAVAAAAMAQDELGHARSFYPLLRGFPESTEADTREEAGWQDRPTNAMACLDGRFRCWSDFVAANLVVDVALTTLLEAATGSPYEPLRQRARKIRQEEQAHWVHAQGWVRTFGLEANTRSAILASLQAVWDHAFTWYGLPDDPVVTLLMGAGILSAGSGDMRERLRERLTPPLEATGLADELLTRSLPWERWDPQARRLRPEGS